MWTRLSRTSTDCTAGTIEKACQQFTTNANVNDDLKVDKDTIDAIFQSKAYNKRKVRAKNGFTDWVVKPQTSMCGI